MFHSPRSSFGGRRSTGRIAPPLGKAIPEKLTSRVIKEVNDFADLSFLVPHEALRREMRRAEELLPYLKLGHDWRIERFFKWWRLYFYPFLHGHHDNEEIYFFPALEWKCGRLPEQCTCSHATLMATMDDIIAAERTYRSATTSRRGKARIVEDVCESLEKWFPALEQHLAEEEELITPLIRSNYTEAEYEAMLERFLRQQGLNDARISLPRIIDACKDWMTPESFHTFTMDVPWLIRLLYKYFWEPEFRKDRALIKDIMADEPPKRRGLCAGGK
ncbi:unnamed protein product [Vitrella brassicaformis CCMP3155]|uniref:Hemerythrin-like domain-containing protein n=1 Tax=Vitrella brassicaformis (strain CCMP3155) TaxID=1169540 RepID=A0A0G4FLY0_VITBC|nr:unnamed protein product [Vitrella brassicaformis CCMP3155]|eukprot:CEM14938.1 unnamed protein product [Vitrella brassicaformis CCMP3155]